MSGVRTRRVLRAVLGAAALLLALASGSRPGCCAVAGDCVSLPPAFEDHAAFYASFDEGSPVPEINTLGAVVGTESATAPGGIRGRCLAIRGKGAYVLKSPALSPHRALTVSFWWAPAQDADPGSGIQLFSLEGRGFISNFLHGKGEWCALDRPALVLQIQNFPAVPNVNNIYDRDPLAKGTLKAGAWHHTVLTVSAGRSLALYTDGALVCREETRSRSFTPEDAIGQLTLGNRYPALGMLLDEVLVLERALSPEEIADYHTALRRMHEAEYP